MIEFSLTPRDYADGQQFWLPVVEATVLGLETRFAAVVDTGAAVSVVDRVVLESAGWSDDEIRAGERIAVEGIGGKREGWLTSLDLVLGTQPTIILREVTCFVCEEPPDAILLGQQQALEVMVLLQNGPDRVAQLSRP